MHPGIYFALSALAVTVLVIAAMDAAVRHPVEESTASVIGHRSKPVPVKCGWDAGAVPSTPAPSGGGGEVPALSRFTIEYSGDPGGFPEEEIRACLGDLLEADGRYIRTDYRVDHSGGGAYVVTIHGLWGDEVGTMSSMLSDMDGITGVSHESEPHSDPWNLGYTLFVIEYDGPGELPTGEIIGVLDGLLEADGRHMPLEYRTFHPEVLVWKFSSSYDFPVKEDARVMIVPGLWKDWSEEPVPFRTGEPGAAGGLLVWKDGPAEAALESISGMTEVNLIEPYLDRGSTVDQDTRYDHVIFAMEYNGDPNSFPSEIRDALGGHRGGVYENLWIAHPDRDWEHSSAGGSWLSNGTRILIMNNVYEYEIELVRDVLEGMREMTNVSPAAAHSTEFGIGYKANLNHRQGGISLYVRYGGDPVDFPIREIMENKDAVLEDRGEFVPFLYDLKHPIPNWPRGSWGGGNDTYVLSMHGAHNASEVDRILNMPEITQWEHVVFDWPD